MSGKIKVKYEDLSNFLRENYAENINLTRKNRRLEKEVRNLRDELYRYTGEIKYTV